MNNKFKILRLKFSKHPFLNDVTGDEAIEFVSSIEQFNGPFTTVLIGANGVGKSQILRIIADIIEDLNNRTKSKTIIVGKIKFNYEMVFLSNDKTYILTHFRKIEIEKNGKPVTRVSLIINEFDYKNDRILNETPVKLVSNLLPTNIVVLSYLVNDKFRFQSRQLSDFYTYLGLRDTPSSARTRSFSNRVISFIINELLETKNSSFIKRVIKLIDYDENYLEIKYKLRYKNTFFKGDLTEDKLKKLFKNWKSFSKRKSEPYSVIFFKSLVEKRPEDLKNIVKLINGIARDSLYNLSTDDRFFINILSEDTWDKYIEHLDTILKLDLIEQSSIRFKKKSRNVSEESIDLANFSSGEFHLFTSYIALKATVKSGSLILIDEPEISLHPNWQMKYINDLKDFFSEDVYSGCHFLIATHSHFLISDLKDDTSEIVKLDRDIKGNLIPTRIKMDTYGLSAEEILLTVFKTPSTRNYYLAELVGNTIELMAHKELTIEQNKIYQSNLSTLKKMKLSLRSSDPLKSVIEKILE